MGKTDGERLKRWRKKQREAGRRHISFMLSMTASRELEEIQAETGESVSRVFDRLLTKQGLPKSAKAIDTRQEPTFDIDIDLNILEQIKSRITPDKKKTLDMIKALRQDHGLSHIQIADYLNRKSIATFGTGEAWSQGTIGKILKREDVR